MTPSRFTASLLVKRWRAYYILYNDSRACERNAWAYLRNLRIKNSYRDYMLLMYFSDGAKFIMSDKITFEILIACR